MRDADIQSLIVSRLLVIDIERGLVFSPNSNTPDRPLGAVTKKGYLRTCLNCCGSPKTVMVHRIVCIAAHGIPPAGRPFVNHINGKKTDNSSRNLEWVSHTENMSHSRRLGLHRHCGRSDGIRDGFGRFGKKSAGRLLDGREWSEFPNAQPDEVSR
ncbi:MAG: HNH endonuclease [Patescibacteria group bacterium]|nr:HNH endonuclease [Patescibacteria group bacterium]